MAAHEINTRFKLEGEREYKKAMTDAANAIKVLNSEQKLAAAEFENTGDAEQYAATQARILKEQIANQEKAVKAAEDAIKKLTDNGVSPSSKEFQTWQTKLNNAKSSLTSMKTQLGNTESKIKTQNTAVKDAQTEYSTAESKIKSLTAEEKLAEAQFKATGDKEQYAATKTSTLKSKIAATEEQVAAAEAAIKSMTENGVDPNSKEMQSWKTKLYNAKTSLTAMKGELGNVEGELDDQTESFGEAETAGGEYQGQLDKIGKGFDVNNTIQAIDNITGKIENAAKAAARAAKAIWDLGSDAGDWADELLTTSSQMGIDVETLQSWRYASRFIDTSVDDISKSWQDLTKRIKDGDVEYLGYLAEMGVASMNTDGTMRESADIFWDMIDVLHAMEDPQERAAAATKLFGNDWRNLNPLIEAGSEAYKDLAEEGRETAVVSEENVQALGAMDDQMEKTQAAFDKLKYDALAAMAPTFEKIAAAMETAITALDTFLESAEGQEMLASLNESLSGIIDAFIGENGEGFSSLVDAAKSALSGLNDALKWIADNKDGLVTAVEAIAAAFAALKVSSTVLEFVKLAQGAKGLFNFGGNGGTPSVPNIPKTDNPTNNPVTDLAKDAGKMSLWDKVKGKLKDLGDNALDAAITAGPWAFLLAATKWEWDTIKEAMNDPEFMRTYFGEGNTLSDEMPTGQTQGESLGGIVASAIGKAQRGESYGKDLVDEIVSAAEYLYGDAVGEEQAFAILNAITRNFNPVEGNGMGMEGLYEDLAGYFGEDFADQMMPLIEQAMSGAAEQAEESGEGVADGLAEGIEGESGTVVDAVAAMSQNIIDTATSALDEHSPSKVFDTIGRNAAIGLANGIYAGGNSAILAALWLAKSVENIVRSALQIHSPSAVFDDLGNFVGEGFAEGIEGSADNVSRAVDKMVGATMRRPVMSIGGYSVSPVTGARAGSGAGAAGAADMVNVTLVLDGEVLGSVMAPIVNDKIGAKIQATRR